MKSLAVLLLTAVISFAAAAPVRAEPLSADAVFAASADSAQDESQNIAQKLERTKKLFAEKEHAAASGKQAAAWKTESDSVTLAGTGFKMLQGLGLCIGVLLIGLHFFKKYNPQNNPRAPGRSMRIIEKMTVAPKTSLVLATVEGKKILFAVGNERVSFFSTQDAQDELPAHFDTSLDLLCQDDVKTSDA